MKVTGNSVADLIYQVHEYNIYEYVRAQLSISAYEDAMNFEHSVLIVRNEIYFATMYEYR